MEDNKTFIDYINNVCSDLHDKFNLATEKLLIQDIIMIYNNCYTSYEEYVDNMQKANNRIKEFDILGVSFSIHPNHIIIRKEVYDFIKKLRGVYK